MNKKYLFLILSQLLSAQAQAYLPPAFYFYEKIAGGANKQVPGSFSIRVSRPAPNNSEESLGIINIKSITSTPGGWPTLSLLFADDPTSLILSIERFGIPVAKEKDLLRASREQAAAMKEAPRPFYFRDKKMSLKRMRNIYALVHGVGDERGKFIWAEKETFTPLKIAAPCPEGLESLPWLKAGANRCEIEFRGASSARRGSYSSTKMILSRDGSPALFFSFEKVLPRGAAPLAEENGVPADILNITSILFH